MHRCQKKMIYGFLFAVVVYGVYLSYTIVLSYYRMKRQQKQQTKSLTESFAPQCKAEYGVEHHLYVQNVALRCKGASRNPLCLHIDDAGVGLHPESENVSRWNIYQGTNSGSDSDSDDSRYFTLALHSDPAMVLHPVEGSTEVRVSRLLGPQRFCWTINTIVSSNATLQVTIQERQQQGYLGPSWSVPGADAQGPVSAGSVLVTDWQRFSVVTDFPEADGQECISASGRAGQECHWSSGAIDCRN